MPRLAHLLFLLAVLITATTGCSTGPQAQIRKEALHLFRCSSVEINRVDPQRSGPGDFDVSGCGGNARFSCTDAVEGIEWYCKPGSEISGAWVMVQKKIRRCNGCFMSEKKGCVREEGGTPGCGGQDCPQVYVSVQVPCDPDCCE
jgi:hypothetical protein